MLRKKPLQLFLHLLLLAGCSMKDRNPEALYYFPNSDTTMVGLINGKGDTIIPPVYPYFNYDIAQPLSAQKAGRIFYSADTTLIPYEAFYDFESPVTSELIFFAGPAAGRASISPALPPAGAMHDREGQLLYEVPGYIRGQQDGYRFIVAETAFQEGFALYTDKGKVGFVDNSGCKVLNAIWDFAEPFQYGYAKVYGGGWQQEIQAGTVLYKPLSDSAYTCFITADGRKVKPVAHASSSRDNYIGDGLFLPDPFRYATAERHLVDSLSRLKGIAYTNFDYMYRAGSSADSLLFEITAPPSGSFPYYFIQGYYVLPSREQDGRHASGNEYVFLVHKDTRAIFFYDQARFPETRKKIPLAQWMAGKLDQMQEWWTLHYPDAAPIKELAAALSYWKAEQQKAATQRSLSQ